MKTRNAIKRIVALGTGFSMVGATLFGAMATYDLSDYPAPFIQNGRANGVIVVGDNAASSDVIGGVDVGSSWQFFSYTEQVSPGGVTSTVLVGDSTKVGDSSDLFEIQELIGNVKETVTEFDLNALRGGLVSTDEGTTDYNQYIRFEDTGANSFASTGRVVFEEDEDDEVGDFLFFRDNFFMFEYELEFEEGVESRIEDNTCDLTDLEDEILTIIGEEFSVVDTDVRAGTTLSTGLAECQGDSTAADRITIELIGGAILDTLEEGETKTYTYNGKEYQVNVLIVSDSANNNEGSVKFRINGFVTDELEDGETEILSDGTQIGIREILPNEAEEISGGDLVEFYLGANEVEFTDSNYTDNRFDSSGVEVNEENIEDARVMIIGTVLTGSGDTFEIDTIKYRLEADSPKGDVYIKPGQGLREYLDEPEGMLNPNWDIRYEGLEDTGVSIIKFDAAGDDSYDLRFTNKKGIDLNIPLAYKRNDEGLGLQMGDDDDDLIHCEGFNETDHLIDEDDFFVLTDDNDETGFTHILSYESADTTNRELTFTDEGIGNREITYEATTAFGGSGRGRIVVGGNVFEIHVGPVGTAGDANISVDLDNDGAIEGDEAFIIVQGGGIIDIWDNRSSTDVNGSIVDHPFNGTNPQTCWINGSAPIVGQQEKSGSQFNNGGAGEVANMQDYTSYAGVDRAFNNTLTTLNSEFDENGPNNGDINGDGESDVTTDEVIFIEIDDLVNNEVNLAVPEIVDVNVNVQLESLDEVDLQQALSLYGVFLELTDNDEVDEAEELTIEYPFVQRGGNVFIVAGQTARAQTGLTQQYTRNLDIAMLASEVGNIQNVNSVLVGGPCANAVTAELMGNPEVCTEGFVEGKAMIRAIEHANGNVAIIVAGMTALDTRRAAKVLARWDDYNLAGTEVEVSGTSLTDITVRTV